MAADESQDPDRTIYGAERLQELRIDCDMVPPYSFPQTFEQFPSTEVAQNFHWFPEPPTIVPQAHYLNPMVPSSEVYNLLPQIPSGSKMVAENPAMYEHFTQDTSYFPAWSTSQDMPFTQSYPNPPTITGDTIWQPPFGTTGNPYLLSPSPVLQLSSVSQSPLPSFIPTDPPDFVVSRPQPLNPCNTPLPCPPIAQLEESLSWSFSDGFAGLQISPRATQPRQPHTTTFSYLTVTTPTETITTTTTTGVASVSPVCFYPSIPMPVQQAETWNPVPKGPEGCNLFIYPLPPYYHDTQLASVFAPFGTIVSANIYIDRFTGLSKCFGFVSFDNPESAQHAIQCMDGYILGNRRLTVELKRPKGK